VSSGSNDPAARLGWIPVAALIGALAAAALPLASPWTIAGQSSLIELVRVQAFHAAVSAGDLWPVWLPDLYARHGSPLPLFYAPLAYLPVELARAAGLGATAAIHLAFVLLWGAAAAGAAWAARVWFGPGAGAAAGIVYALSPYFVADVYVRSGLAEVAALAVLPWALGALIRPGRRAFVAGALAVAALVLSHNISALVGVPVLVAAALLAGGELRRRGVLMIALGVALSAFFWWPALREKEQIQAEESLTAGHFDYRRHFLRPERLLPGRTAVSLASAVGPRRPVRVGELLWLGLLAAPLAARGADRPPRRRAGFLAAGTIFALAMTTSISAPLWAALPLLRFVQFPFRWLLFVTLFGALLAGFVARRLPSRRRPLVVAATAALALVLARPLLEPRYAFVERATLAPVFTDRGGLDRAVDDARLVAPEAAFAIEALRSRPVTGTSAHDFLPRGVERPPLVGTGAAEPLAAGLEVLEAAWGYPEVRATVRATARAPLALHQFDFPGWRVEVDGVRRPHRTEPVRGRIVVDLAPGDREVVARFGWTPERAGAAAASAATALGLALWLALGLRRSTGEVADGPIDADARC
jgi:hypothetical protein